MLPKLSKPTFSVTIPSTKKSTTFQMLSRRDEKVLLIAKTSNDPLDWLASIKQVVQGCAADPSFDINKIASFDLEYIFLRLRAMSIGSKEKLTYRDHSDDKEYTVEVDLEKIPVVFPEGASNVIQVSDKITIQMRWPSAQTWSDNNILKATDPEAALDELVAGCIEKVWVESEVFDASGASREEKMEFLDALDVKAWEKIRNFISKTPHLSHWIEWTNSKGEQRKFELTNLADFFPFASGEGP